MKGIGEERGEGRRGGERVRGKGWRRRSPGNLKVHLNSNSNGEAGPSP